ncbi:MAG: DNA polymerase III subunit delta [Pseudomonadota bacterium]
MRLDPDQLPGHLERGPLAPLYLLSGDEPLQLQEARDRLLKAARDQGFSDIQRLEADRGFDWSRLAAEANALSLFAERRLIDLAIPSGKPGTEGGRALSDYCTSPPPDTLLMVRMPKLDKAQRSTKWFKAVDRLGVTLSVWPVDARALPGWLERRARARGMRLDKDAAAFLASQVEGNLLAAAQELEKLLLLQGPTKVSVEQVAASVGGSARYNVFDLADSALGGDAPRVVRILAGLRAEGTPGPVVLWSLARDARVLGHLTAALESGMPAGRALAAQHVWEQRRKPYVDTQRRLGAAGCAQLIHDCAAIDRALKGQGAGEPWQMLEDSLLFVAGSLPVTQG